jgi:hypothetical protein
MEQNIIFKVVIKFKNYKILFQVIMNYETNFFVNKIHAIKERSK